MRCCLKFKSSAKRKKRAFTQSPPTKSSSRFPYEVSTTTFTQVLLASFHLLSFVPCDARLCHHVSSPSGRSAVITAASNFDTQHFDICRYGSPTTATATASLTTHPSPVPANMTAFPSQPPRRSWKMPSLPIWITCRLLEMRPPYQTLAKTTHGRMLGHLAELAIEPNWM